MGEHRINKRNTKKRKGNRQNRSLIFHTEVIKRYLEGESSVKISRVAGISATGIIRILKHNNIPRREKEIAEKLKRKYPHEKIIEDYKNGIFLCEVAKKYNIG